MIAPYHTILVAYDGTGAGDIALHQGAALAQTCKAQLHVVAIVETAIGPLHDPAVAPGGQVFSERNILLAAMTAAVGNLGESGSSVLTCIRDGNAAAEIGAYAHEIKADLVVLGHSDKGPFATLFGADTGQHLLRHLPCSALFAIGEPHKSDDGQAKTGRPAIAPDAHHNACPAVVLWLPPGEEPTGMDHFNVAARLHSPEQSAGLWLSIRQTIGEVQARKNDHGKLPWIKVGNVVLSPAEIRDLDNFFKHHGTRK